MLCRRFPALILTLTVAVGASSIACGGGAAAEQPASTAAAGEARAPSGSYESKMADGTVIRLSFRGGGAVRIAMTEDGQTAAHEGKWVVNGEVIHVQGGEGMTMQLSWRGDALVTDFGGATMTFTKVAG